MNKQKSVVVTNTYNDLGIIVDTKAEELIHCSECIHYGRADKRRFYRGYDCLDGRIASIVPDRDFCSRAERKEAENGEND